MNAGERFDDDSASAQVSWFKGGMLPTTSFSVVLIAHNHPWYALRLESIKTSVKCIARRPHNILVGILKVKKYILLTYFIIAGGIRNCTKFTGKLISNIIRFFVLFVNSARKKFVILYVIPFFFTKQ